MEEFRKKQHYRRIVYSIPVAIILSLIALVLIKASVGMYIKYHKAQEELDKNNVQYLSMRDREKFLAHAIESFQTDRGVEAEIRDKYNVAKEGEEVIVLVDTGSTTTVEVPKGFWVKIKETIQSIF